MISPTRIERSRIDIFLGMGWTLLMVAWLSVMLAPRKLPGASFGLAATLLYHHKAARRPLDSNADSSPHVTNGDEKQDERPEASVCKESQPFQMVRQKGGAIMGEWKTSHPGVPLPSEIRAHRYAQRRLSGALGQHGQHQRLNQRVRRGALGRNGRRHASAEREHISTRVSNMHPQACRLRCPNGLHLAHPDIGFALVPLKRPALPWGVVTRKFSRKQQSRQYSGTRFFGISPSHAIMTLLSSSQRTWLLTNKW